MSISMDRHLQIVCRAWCKFDPWSVGFKSNQGFFQTAHTLFGWRRRKNHGKATQGARKRTAKKWDITYVVNVRRPWVGSKGSRDTSHGQRTSLGPKLHEKSVGNLQGAPDLEAQRRLIKAKKRKKEKNPSTPHCSPGGGPDRTNWGRFDPRGTIPAYWAQEKRVPMPIGWRKGAILELPPPP